MERKRMHGKIIPAISVLTVFVLLSAAVYADSSLSSAADGDYIVAAENADGQVMEYDNKPFVQDGTVYLPLRETFEQLGYTEENSRLSWNNGTIDAAILAWPMNNGYFRMRVGSALLSCDVSRDTSLDNSRIREVLDRAGSFGIIFEDEPAVVLRDSVTYVPSDMMTYICYRFFGERNDDGSLCEFRCSVYDSAGNEIPVRDPAGYKREAADVGAAAR